MTPTPLDINAITVDGDARTVTIYTTSNPTGINYLTTPATQGLTYTVEVWISTEGGVTKTGALETLSFTVTISDPCMAHDIDIQNGAVPSSQTSYIIGEAAEVITFDYN